MFFEFGWNQAAISKNFMTVNALTLVFVRFQPEQVKQREVARHIFLFFLRYPFGHQLPFRELRHTNLVAEACRCQLGYFISSDDAGYH